MVMAERDFIGIGFNENDRDLRRSQGITDGTANAARTDNVNRVHAVLVVRTGATGYLLQAV
jgi:hypothetical protein